MSERWPEKVIIGLTGNIATGKSVVMDLAASQGTLTLDADKIVHEILNGDPAIQEAIASAFGPAVRQLDGRINRAALAAIVFSDSADLEELERIVHPAVRQVLLRRISASEANIVFIEAIKLLEGTLAAECDQIWVTSCPVSKQIQRLVICRGMDEETAKLRITAQPPQERKIAQADIVIDTDGTMAETRNNFELAWRDLTQGSVREYDEMTIQAQKRNE
jgi:dephospho-CoA kinase